MCQRIRTVTTATGIPTYCVGLLLLSCIVAGAAPGAYASESAPSTPQAIQGSPGGPQLGLDDVLDLLTFEVHTVFKRSNGTTVERTVPATVGVPALVNVRGGLLPEIAVEVLPLPPNLVTVSFVRLPTAIGRMDLLAEVIVDIPGGTGASFGFDTRDGGDMPPALNTNLTLGLGAGGTTINLFANTAFPGSTPTMDIVGEVFTRGADSARIDPVGGRVGFAPVPGVLHVGFDANRDETNPTFDVVVNVGQATTATIGARRVTGDLEQTIDAVVDQVPENLSVSVVGDKGDPASTADDQLDVFYRASAPINRLQASLFQRTAGVIDGHIQCMLDAVPPSIDVGRLGTRTTLTATEPIGNALVGFNLTEDTPLPAPEDTPAEPIFALAEIDSGAADVFRQAAIRVPGVRSVLVDTADPLVVELTSAGGPLRAKLYDISLDGGDSVDALVDPLPEQAKITVAGGGAAITYESPTPIARLTADVKLRPRVGVGVRHLAADLTGVPKRVDVGVAGKEVTLTATESVGVALVGFNRAEESPLPPADTPAEPVFVLAELDSSRGQGNELRQAAVRVPGVSSLFVAPGDPLIVDLVSAGGPATAVITDIRENGQFSIDVTLDALPGDARVVFSPTAVALLYDGDAMIEVVTAQVTDPAGIGKPGKAGVIPTQLDLRVEQLPGDLLFLIPPPDTETDIVAFFDAFGAQVGAIDALLTSGPVERLPDAADGVLLRDLADRFVLHGHITGLRHASLRQADDLERSPLQFGVATGTTTLTLDAPLPDGTARELLVDVGRPVEAGEGRLILDLDERPNTVTNLELTDEQSVLPGFEPGSSIGTFFRRLAIDYDADRPAGDLVACQRAGAVLPDFDCEDLATDPTPLIHELGLAARVEPLPATLDVCLANDEENFGRDGALPAVDCLGGLPDPPVNQPEICDEVLLDCRDDRFLVKTALEFAASGPVEVDFFQCNELHPDLDICHDFVAVQDLSLTVLRAQIDPPLTTGDIGYAFLDTDNTPVTGSVDVVTPLTKNGDAVLELNLPDRDDDSEEFKASDMLQVFEGQITGLDGSVNVVGFPRRGSCQRPPGTEIRAQIAILGGVLQPSFQVANDLCPPS